jgi:hypothetical protein
MLLAVAGLIAFLTRTPLRVALVDRHRNRRLDRTRLADRVVMAYAGLLAVVSAAAVAASGHVFWPPVLLALPLVVLSFWYDMRSRSRRLIPELAGTIGIAAMATVIALAGGSSADVAYGLWVVAAARGIASVTHVRVQVARTKAPVRSVAMSDAGQAIAVLVVALGVAAGHVSWWALGAIGVLGLVHLVLVRRPAPRVALIGAQQVVLGLSVVITAALGAIAP